MVEVTGNLSVNFRPDLNVLFCRFIQPTSSTLLRKGYEEALQKAHDLQARFWLFDLRRRGPARAEDEDWILDYFFPRAESLAKGPQYVAYLVTPTHYQHIREIVSLERLLNFTPLTHIAIFDAEDKAIDWLSLNQATEVQV